MNSKVDLFDDRAGENSFEAGCLAVMPGETARNYMGLDPRMACPDGEMDIVTFDFALEEHWFKTLAEYLQDKLDRARRLSERENLEKDNGGDESES